MQKEGDSAPVSRQRLDGLAVLEYRTKVVDRLGVTAEWRELDWTDQAACANHVTLDVETVRALPRRRRVPCGGRDHRRPRRVARQPQPSRPRTSLGRPGEDLPSRSATSS